MPATTVLIIGPLKVRVKKVFSPIGSIGVHLRNISLGTTN